MKKTLSASLTVSEKILLFAEKDGPFAEKDGPFAGKFVFTTDVRN
jgi:hypothetical protein